MEINDFIGQYPQSVGKDVCEKMIEHFEKVKQLPGIGEFGGANNSNRRNDEAGFFESITLHNDPGLRPVAKNIDDFNQGLQSCFDKYTSSYALHQTLPALTSKVVKIHKVKPHEGYHAFHPEVGGMDSLDRCLVWLCYLNNVEEGGETEFLYQGIKVQPEQGKMILWPAQWTHTHRGNPIYNGLKYYATGWFMFLE